MGIYFLKNLALEKISKLDPPPSKKNCITENFGEGCDLFLKVLLVKGPLG
jgi:hypothetical protein